MHHRLAIAVLRNHLQVISTLEEFCEYFFEWGAFCMSGIQSVHGCFECPLYRNQRLYSGDSGPGRCEAEISPLTSH